MSSTPAPTRTGKPLEELTLDDALIPWKNEQPVLLNMPGSPHEYLALFSSEEKLRELTARAKVEFDSIKQVQEQHEFLESIPQEVVVILDPWYTPEGKVRFKQVMR